MNIGYNNRIVKFIIFFLVVGVLSVIACVTDPFKILDHSEKIKKEIENVDKEFKEYFKKTYNQELIGDSNVEIYYTKSGYGYSGEYFLKKDKSYRIEISKVDSKYEVSYNEKAMAIRQELFDYINEIKGGNMARDYLVFYDNGQDGHISSVSGPVELKYIIYDSSSELTDEKLQSDYNILQKANEILKKYNSNDRIEEMQVTYVTNQDVKTDGWADKVCNGINSSNYTSLGYCFNNKDVNDINHYDCNYFLDEDYNDTKLSDMTYDQFKQEALKSYNDLK